MRRWIITTLFSLDSELDESVRALIPIPLTDNFTTFGSHAATCIADDLLICELTAL